MRSTTASDESNAPPLQPEDDVGLPRRADLDVQTGRSRVERGERVADAEVPTAVPVPVDADAAALLDHLRDKPHHRRGAGGRGVPDRIGDA